MDPLVRGPVEVVRVGIALALVTAADLQDERAVLGKLQQLVIRNRLQPGQPIQRHPLRPWDHVMLRDAGSSLISPTIFILDAGSNQNAPHGAMIPFVTRELVDRVMGPREPKLGPSTRSPTSSDRQSLSGVQECQGRRA